MRIILFDSVIPILLISLSTLPGIAQEQTQPQAAEQQPAMPLEWIRIITPPENAEFISKRPEIKTELLTSINLSTLVVLIDGTDVTQLISADEKGFYYKPTMVLSAGEHTITVVASDINGMQLQKNFSFATRQTSSLEELYASNNDALMFTIGVKKLTTDPKSKLEGNFNIDSRLKNKAWEFVLTTNARLLIQDSSVMPPMEEGFDLANITLNGSYRKDKLLAQASVGDVQITETQSTVQGLARKGGLFNVNYNDEYQLSFFTVKSEQIYGVQGIGLSANTNDQISGISASVQLLNKKVAVKTVYATGGEPNSSLGISTTLGAKKGDVLGIAMVTDLFSNKLRTEFETDFANFDPDTSDEFKSKKDQAYTFKAGGYFTKYNYEAMYQYIGPHYSSIGNQGLQKDKQIFSLRNGFILGVHTITVTVANSTDNVKDNALFPRIGNLEGSIDYFLNKNPNIPVTFSYRRSRQKSSNLPDGSMPFDLNTNCFTGTISFRKNFFNLGFQGSYSINNDATIAKAGSTAISFGVMPTYASSSLSIMPSFIFNQTKQQLTNVKNNTYTLAVDFRSKFFKQKASFDVAPTYMISKSSDKIIDSKNLNANVIFSIYLGKYLWGLFEPSLSFKGSYMRFTDAINTFANRDDKAFYIMLNSAIPFSF